MTPGLEQLLARVKYDARGLVPVVAQELDGTVLMVAWANAEALRLTVETGKGTYWSRSRRALWVKGDTSGHFQAVHELALDCDGDTVLYRVAQTGPACHTGERSCFLERQALPWQTNTSSPSSGPPSSRARPTARRPRATRASSSSTPPRSGGRSSRKRTR